MLVDGIEHGICSNGSTIYVFDTKGDRHSLRLTSDAVKGVSVMTNCVTRGSKIVLSNESLVSIVCGTYKNRLCMGCYSRISKVVKIRDDCKNLSYCSTECLSSACEFIDTCGGMIDNIYTNSSFSSSSGGMEDLLFMVVKLLFQHLQLSSIRDYVSLDSALRCETHSTIENSDLRKQSKALYALLRTSNSPLLYNSDGKETFDDSLIYTLLCAFQYNAQPFPVPGLKGTHILSLFPTLSKLNHSCTPNAVLQFGINQGRVIGYLKLLRDVQPNEEICISYLSQTCLSYENRQDLLLQAFQFKCCCELCTPQSRCLDSPLSGLKEDNERMIAVGNSSSGSVGGIDVRAQIGKAEELLSASLSDDDQDSKHAAVVTAHDTALLVLQYCQSAPTGAAASDLNSLAVRACLIVCTCSKLCGGGSLLSTVDFMVMCGQFAFKARMSQEHVSSDLTVRVKALLVETTEILNRFYCSKCEERVPGLLESDYTSGSGLMRDYNTLLLNKCEQLLRAM